MRPRSLLCAAAIAVASSLMVTSAAQADVAYVDGNEVWLSTLDGSQKVRLSSGEGDWRDVAVSDQGFVVGIRLESGKVADLSTFTVWDPQGKRIKFGPLVGLRNGGSNAFPLNLQISPDGGLLVYGFSNLVYGYPVGQLTTGFILLPSATTALPALSPVNVTAAKFPSLVGQRVVGAISDGILGVQDPSSVGSSNFTPWPGIDASSLGYINSLDVAGTGTKVALNIYYPNDQQRLIVVPTPGLGQAPVPLPNPVVPGDVGDCFVPATGNTYHPSFSQDGSKLAWSDGGGVKAAGSPKVIPTDGVENLCTMSSPIVTISPTGKYPSIGPISVATVVGSAPAPAPTSVPTPVPTPVPTQPSSPGVGKTSVLRIGKLASKKGAKLTVTSATAGKVTVRLTVKPSAVGRSGGKPILIAKGKKQLQAGVKGKVKVKFTSKGRALRKKLKSAKVTLKVSAGGYVTTKTFKLR